MNNSFRLALEQFKKDARFKLNLPPEQAEHLAQQVQPLTDTLQALQTRVSAIRKDGNLSTAGQNTKVAEAKAEVGDFIVKFADGISRHKVIADLSGRVQGKVKRVRSEAAAAQKDSAMLSLELRQHILPAMIREAKAMQISPSRTTEKLMLEAAEDFANNPAKSEMVLSALSIGKPFCPNVSRATMKS